MNREKELEIVALADKVFKERMESMLKVVESKYTEVVKERASNDVYNQNFAEKSKYPVKSILSFILKDGEFAVPYETDTEITLEFFRGNENCVVHLNTKNNDKFDIRELMRLNATNDYCIVKTKTLVDVELFDEEALEKDDVIKKVKNEFSQTFEGMYRCSDVVGVYQNFSKFTVVEEIEE